MIEQRNLHHVLQSASVALSEGFPEAAARLAEEVLVVHPGQPQAEQVLDEARKACAKASLIERNVGGSFFLQKMNVTSVESRMEIFGPLITGRSVLHVGCTDWPVFAPATNLHIQIAPLASDLCGLDTDEPGLDVLRQHVPGRYFRSVDEVLAADAVFDVLLVPETIEHVSNPEGFLTGLDRIPFDTWLLTAPCVYGSFAHPTLSYKTHNQSIGPHAEVMRLGSFIEEVHPDHKYWFTPYTLANLIQSAVPWAIHAAYLAHQGRQVCLVGSKRNLPRG